MKIPDSCFTELLMEMYDNQEPFVIIRHSLGFGFFVLSFLDLLQSF